MQSKVFSFDFPAVFPYLQGPSNIFQLRGADLAFSGYLGQKMISIMYVAQCDDLLKTTYQNGPRFVWMHEVNKA